MFWGEVLCMLHWVASPCKEDNQADTFDILVNVLPN